MNEEYGHLPDGFLLNPEEIQELRKQKYEITEYAKEKFRKMNEEAAKREVQEEAGYDGHTEMISLSVFEKGTFKYENSSGG